MKCIYKQGETIELFGSTYLVDKIYQVSNKFMKEHNLMYKTRVTLKKIKGENGDKIMDFALTENHYL